MVFHCLRRLTLRAAAFSFSHFLDYDFGELKVLGFHFRVVASIVFGKWIRCDCVVVVVVIRHDIRVLKHHSVATAAQVVVANATGFLDDVRRVRRYRGSRVVH